MATEMSMQQELATARSPLRKAKILVRRSLRRWLRKCKLKLQ